MVKTEGESQNKKSTVICIEKERRVQATSQLSLEYKKCRNCHD